LKVKRYWIMHAGSYTFVFELLLKSFTVGNAYHEKVPYRLGIFIHHRHSQIAAT